MPTSSSPREIDHLIDEISGPAVDLKSGLKRLEKNEPDPVDAAQEQLAVIEHQMGELATKTQQSNKDVELAQVQQELLDDSH